MWRCCSWIECVVSAVILILAWYSVGAGLPATHQRVIRTSDAPTNVAPIRSTDPPTEAEEMRCLGSRASRARRVKPTQPLLGLHRPLMPLGERTGLWPGAVLSPEQSFEHAGIGARHIEYLHPASRSCHQRHRAMADSERRSHRGQRSRGRLTVHGSLTDPHHQGPIVLAADTRTGRPRPDPNSNTHGTSVPLHAVPSASGPSRHHCPPAHSRDEAYRQPGATRVRPGFRRARAGLPPCTASGHRVRVRVDRLRCSVARTVQIPNCCTLAACACEPWFGCRT